MQGYSIEATERSVTRVPLDYSHNLLLVAASFAIAVMAGFTGLSMTRGLSQATEAVRKAKVAMAAVILGGGIWSMHFVAMLGLQLPILFYYDALTTLISALIAILVVGLGLIILHFRPRSAASITAAGVIMGLGILVMHYTGMAGMQACRPSYTTLGLVLSVSTSLTLSIAAVWAAYVERLRRNVLLGALGFAMAVVALHFIAIAGTQFIEAPLATGVETLLSNQTLAFVVTLAAFAICGGFLLAGASFFPPPAEPAPALPAEAATPPAAASLSPSIAVPYEQDGRTMFSDPSRIAAFRAEGHYTILYQGTEKLFCPWSISEAARRLEGTRFLRTHRSYLVNPDFVSGFERKKDSGVVFFGAVDALEKIPVSRSRLAEVRETLGL